MAAPITPNTPNVDGLPITIFCDFTSTGATKRDTCDLPTYAPLVDLRIGHPVISMALITYATNSTGSEAYKTDNEMARGTSADSAGEFDIADHNTIGIYHAANDNGCLAVCYIPFGAQEA